MNLDSEATLSRRYGIIKYLTANGMVHYQELADEFNVSRPTISEDLFFIENILNVPIEHSYGRYGGIKIADGWKDGKLTTKETELLMRLFPMLESLSDKETMSLLLLRMSSSTLKSDIHKVIDKYFRT